MSHARYPNLHDRVVFITGGGSGIGAAMVEAFVAQGSNVAFVDIAKDESLRVVERAVGPQKPLFIECDLTNLAALEAAMVETRQRLGPIAVLVNNVASDDRHSRLKLFIHAVLNPLVLLLAVLAIAASLRLRATIRRRRAVPGY